MPKFVYRNALEEAVARGVAQPRKQRTIFTWKKALEQRLDCVIVVGANTRIQVGFTYWKDVIALKGVDTESHQLLRESFPHRIEEADLPRFLMWVAAQGGVRGCAALYRA